MLSRGVYTLPAVLGAAVPPMVVHGETLCFFLFFICSQKLMLQYTYYIIYYISLNISVRTNFPSDYQCSRESGADNWIQLPY